MRICRISFCFAQDFLVAFLTSARQRKKNERHQLLQRSVLKLNGAGPDILKTHLNE